jgi:hypothetical protein
MYPFRIVWIFISCNTCIGNLPEIFQSQVGVPDFKYQRLYGDVVRVKGPFGVRTVIHCAQLKR